MGHTVHCSCGQAIKVPANLTHRKARCNKCGAIVRLDGAATVETSDLESLPAHAESPGAGEPKACDDCAKRFPYDQLRKVGGDLLCTRCRIKRDDARRRRVATIVKSIAAVVVLVAGGIAWVNWVGPAIAKYRESQVAVNSEKDPGKKPAPANRPPPPSTNDAPKDAAAPPPPVTPTTPLAPTGDLADFRGAQLIAIAPAGNTIALFKRDSKRPPRHTIRLFDLADGHALKSLKTDCLIDHMAISDNGTRLMTQGRVGANAQLQLWDLAGMKVIASSPVLESFGRVGIAPDGSAGWCLCPQEGIRIVDAKSATVEVFREPHVGSAYAHYDAPNRLAAVKCNFGEGGRVIQWIDIYDLDKKRLLHKIDPGERFGCFNISPDGSLIALGFADRIDLYHFQDFRWRRKGQVGRADMKNAPERVMITADNRHVIELPFGADGRSPVVRDMEGDGVRKLDAPACIDWALGPAGKLYVLSEGDAVKRFDVATGKAE